MTSIFLVSLLWASSPGPELPECNSNSDCADLDQDGIRDDGCIAWTCVDGACVDTPTVYGDMGGPFGSCAADIVADGNDHHHAVNCFANVTLDGDPGYPCEQTSPFAINVDVAGFAAPCAPDGVCDGNDAYAALNAFSDVTTCACPLDRLPASEDARQAQAASPVIVDSVTIRLVPSTPVAMPGDVVEVDILLGSPVDDLRGYQLHHATFGTNADRFELIDQFIEDREDHLFYGLPYWDAYNLTTRQLLAGLDTPGVPGEAGAYLATLVFRVSGPITGSFTVDLRADLNDASQRTFLFATQFGDFVDVERTEPAVVEVDGSVRRHMTLPLDRP